MGVIEVLLVGVLLVCSYTDLKERKILNIILFPAAGLALILHLVFSGVDGAVFWVKGTLTGLALLFLPFLLGGIGAGDVKLLGVVGAFKGAAFVVAAFLCAALIGGIFSIISLWKRKKLQKTLGEMGGALKLFVFTCFRVNNLSQLNDDDTTVLPYGLVIALGTIFCLVGELLCLNEVLYLGEGLW